MSDTLPVYELHALLRRQYGAALAMLRAAVSRCPEVAWTEVGSDAPRPADRPRPAPWQIAYHGLFFTHLYLMPDDASFVPWSGHVADTQNPDGLAGPPVTGDPRPLLPPPYARDQVLAYADWIEARLDDWLAALDLTATTSGFSWYPVSKLEHQLISLRHLQHHAAHLIGRVLDAGADPGGWRAAEPLP